MFVVIFRARVRDADDEYTRVASRLRELALSEFGCLEFVSALDGADEIALSYWPDEASIVAWKRHGEHVLAQELVPLPASSIRVSAALDADLARRPPRIGFGLSFVGAANDLHADHPRQPESNLRAGVLGRERWYERYVVEVAEITRAYRWSR
jgi:hypothetical protein